MWISNPLVVSAVQSIISAVDNLYSVDIGTVKDPDASAVQETSHSEEPSDEEDLSMLLHYHHHGNM